jgi:hypothetical protein
MALLRSLQMVGVATGEKRDVEKSRQIQRQAEAVRETLADEDLLAT